MLHDAFRAASAAKLGLPEKTRTLQESDSLVDLSQERRLVRHEVLVVTTVNKDTRNGNEVQAFVS